MSRTLNVPRSPAYRPDIDGLRGLAVLAVVLFHAGVAGFGGGYIGVDVFFVISGYLITLLIKDSAPQPLSSWLGEFYLRRGRRILPALFVTALITAAVAMAVLLPWDLAHLGDYLAATSVLLTNVTAWLDRSGYFQSTAAHMALGHFWSIAIEEQFYLLYPLTLVLIARYLGNRRTAVLLALAAGSLAACLWASYHAPNANYYLAPSRAWELLLGAVLASAWWRLGSRAASELVGVLALATLVLLTWQYTPATRYPGLYAIAPCAAAAGLIVSGRDHDTAARRLLRLRPLVFTGLISYSLYLWHFPVLVLSQYYSIVPLAALAVLGLLLLTYGLAVASWWGVERPVRRRAFLASDRAFTVTALALGSGVLIGGLALRHFDGLPWRFPPELRLRDPVIARDDVTPCVTLPDEKIASGALCSYGPQSAQAPRVLVWGDSHAMMLLPEYAKLAESHRVRIYLAATSTCRPLLGVFETTVSAGKRAQCEGFNHAVAQAVRRLKPQLIILNAHWYGADVDLMPTDGVRSGGSSFAQALARTLEQTNSGSRRVCVVMDVPRYQYDLPYALAIARKRGIAEDFLRLTRAQALAQYRGPEADMRRFEQRGLISTVDLKDPLCREQFCRFEAGGQLLYRDRDHLSSAGAQFVARAMSGCFRGFPPESARTVAQ